MVTNAATLQNEVRPRQTSIRTIEIRWGYLFILPWIIGFLLFTAGPMVFSLYLSGTDYNITSNKDINWVGTKNFSDILSLEVRPLKTPSQNAAEVLDRNYAEWFRVGNYVVGASDPDFWISLRVTGLFAMIALPLGMVISLCLALLLN